MAPPSRVDMIDAEKPTERHYLTIGLRECANRSGSAAGSGVPAVKDPGPA
jgi:hypothetical protein